MRQTGALALLHHRQKSVQVNSPTSGTAAVPAIINNATTVESLTVDAGATVAVVSNSDTTVTSSLIVAGAADVAGTVKANSTVSDPSVTFDNGVTVESGGEIEAHGSAAMVSFSGSLGVDNSWVIVADDGGSVIFSNVTVTNGSAGTIEAIDPNSLVELSQFFYMSGGELGTGVLSSAADGMIEIASNLSVFDGSTNAVTVDAYGGG